jgi:hypothetical protein
MGKKVVLLVKGRRQGRRVGVGCVPQYPLHYSVTDTRAGCPCPCLVLRCRRQSGREAGVAEEERKDDMTQGHGQEQGGDATTW